MATPRTESQLLSIFADNSNGEISALDIRDFVVSARVEDNKLNDLDDVNTSGVVDGNVLNYNSGIWTADAFGLENLANVNLPSPTNKQHLKYNAVSSKWEAGDPAITNASDVGVGGVGIYSGKTNHTLELKNISAGSGKITITDDVPNKEIDIDFGTVVLNDIDDVDDSAKANGYVLTYQSGSGNWEAIDVTTILNPASPDTSIQWNDAGDFGGSANLTFDNGTNTLALTGVIDIDNINIDGNTVSSSNTNGDINLSPDGTGTVVINTDLDIDNINVDGNTIVSTNTDGEINITPDGDGAIVLDGLSWPIADSTAGFSIKTDGVGGLYFASGSAGGSDTNIQFNDSGIFGGDNDFAWDKTGNVLTVTGQLKQVDGSQAAGYVLTSDAAGLATWTDPATLVDALNDWAESNGTYGGQEFTKWIPSSATANVDVVLQPKGTGGIQANQSDPGGDNRGNYSIDWQLFRSVSTEVASGNYSVICGGQQNTSSGVGAFVGAGVGNTSTNYRTVVCGGLNNNATGTYASIVGGSDNTSSGNRSFVGGGYYNVSSALESCVAGGTYNTIGSSDSFSFIGGGSNNTINSAYGANVIAGGLSNTLGAYADNCAIVGGYNNDAAGISSFIGGGVSNVLEQTADGCAIVGGDYNSAAGTSSFIGGGSSNTIEAGRHRSVICGGQYNEIKTAGTHGFIGGGNNNDVTASYAAILGGTKAVANKYGQQAHASGSITADGDAQTSQFVVRKQTTDATQTELFLDNSSERLALANDTAWTFAIMVVARNTAANEVGSWDFRGGILRDSSAATTALVGAVEEMFNNSGGNSAVWDVAVDNDTTNGSLRIRVTGEAGHTINWVASIKTVEVTA